MTGSEGKPDVDNEKCALKAFDELAWGQWPEAGLCLVNKYLRGNKYLEVPTDWLSVFPRGFEILHRMELRRQALESKQKALTDLPV